MGNVDEYRAAAAAAATVANHAKVVADMIYQVCEGHLNSLPEFEKEKFLQKLLSEIADVHDFYNKHFNILLPNDRVKNAAFFGWKGLI